MSTNLKDIPLCERPIFIIGSPRSGTTALAWSLAQHSQLWTSEESDILFDLLGWGHVDKAFQAARGRPGEVDWLVVNGVERSEFLGYLGLGLNALVSSRSGGKRWIDQTPRNTLFLDVVMDLFPGAYFLHILRDGRRVVHSMLHFFDARSKELLDAYSATGRMPTWTTDFRAGCKEWAKFVELALSFSARYPNRCLTVKNENLTLDPTSGFRKICAFIQAPYEEASSEFFRTKRVNSSFQQIDDKNPSNKNRANPWKEWGLEQREIFLEEAGDVLMQCGYASEEELRPSKYHHSLFRLRDTVRKVLPQSARIVVISEGDDVLLNLAARSTWHFPRTPEGWHAGHPTESIDAISHLEAVRRQGAEFLIIPEPALWWLNHYVAFREHLDAHYACLWNDVDCRIYRISERASQSPVTLLQTTST